MVIHANLAELQEQDRIQFVDNFELSTGISFFDFSNKIMAKIYQMFFKVELPMVSKEIRSKLQLSIELIGVWFLFRDHAIIKVYGFTGTPYMLPAFMTSRLFYLEYIR